MTMRISLTNTNTYMDWDATVGNHTRRFPFTGTSYGPESTAAMHDALAWIEEHANAATA